MEGARIAPINFGRIERSGVTPSDLEARIFARLLQNLRIRNGGWRDALSLSGARIYARELRRSASGSDSRVRESLDNHRDPRFSESGRVGRERSGDERLNQVWLALELLRYKLARILLLRAAGIRLTAQRDAARMASIS